MTSAVVAMSPIYKSINTKPYLNTQLIQQVYQNYLYINYIHVFTTNMQ